MRTEFSWYPVRCCCQPTKLLGFLRLPENNHRNVVGHDGERHPIELKEMMKRPPLTIMDLAPNQRVLALMPALEMEMAVYSEDRGVEFWRGVPDFVEVHIED